MFLTLQTIIWSVATATSLSAAVDGDNVRISGPSDTPKSESDISVDFTDARRIIAASNNYAEKQLAIFFSTDGGGTWDQTTLPLVGGDSDHADPTVDWTSDGTAWALAIGRRQVSMRVFQQLRAYKSSDGGKSWAFDTTLSGQQTHADKQMMCVDRSPTSSYRDRIYVIWHNDGPAFAGYRAKSGWQPPTRLSGKETTGQARGSHITTNAVGDVFAVWPDSGSKNLFFVKSNDGGVHYTAPSLITRTMADNLITLPAIAERPALAAVSIAAYATDSRNDIYVSWVDLSGQKACDQGSDEPGLDVSSECKSRIWFIRSTDGGKTWERARMINDKALPNDQFHERLAVDRETGLLGIAYYETGTGNDRKKTNVMFQSSFDYGESWSKAIKVTTASTDETDVNASSNQYGEYNGLSVSHGAFFVSWTDRRDGKAEAIFAAKIMLKKNAAGALEPVMVAIPGPSGRKGSKRTP